jgi:hypothetical protein
MLKYLKSDFGIVVLCLVSFYFCTLSMMIKRAKYAIGIVPVYVFIVWTISAIRNTF